MRKDVNICFEQQLESFMKEGRCAIFDLACKNLGQDDDLLQEISIDSIDFQALHYFNDEKSDDLNKFVFVKKFKYISKEQILNYLSEGDEDFIFKSKRAGDVWNREFEDEIFSFLEKSIDEIDLLEKEIEENQDGEKLSKLEHLKLLVLGISMRFPQFWLFQKASAKNKFESFNVQFVKNIKQDLPKMTEGQIVFNLHQAFVKDEEANRFSLVSKFGKFQTIPLTQKQKITIFCQIAYWSNFCGHYLNRILEKSMFSKLPEINTFIEDLSKEIQQLRLDKVASGKMVSVFEKIFKNATLEYEEDLALIFKESHQRFYFENGLMLIHQLFRALSFVQIENIPFFKKIKEDILALNLFKEVEYWTIGIDDGEKRKINKCFYLSDFLVDKGIGVKDFNKWLLKSVFFKDISKLNQSRFYHLLNSKKFRPDFKKNLLKILTVKNEKEIEILCSQQEFVETPYFKYLLEEKKKMFEKGNVSTFNSQNIGDIEAVALFEKGMPLSIGGINEIALNFIKNKNTYWNKGKSLYSDTNHNKKEFESYPFLTEYEKKKRAVFSPFQLWETLPTLVFEEEVTSSEMFLVPYLSERDLLTYGKIFTAISGIEMSSNFIKQLFYVNRYFNRVIDFMPTINQYFKNERSSNFPTNFKYSIGEGLALSWDSDSFAKNAIAIGRYLEYQEVFKDVFQEMDHNIKVVLMDEDFKLEKEWKERLINLLKLEFDGYLFESYENEVIEKRISEKKEITKQILLLKKIDFEQFADYFSEEQDIKILYQHYRQLCLFKKKAHLGKNRLRFMPNCFVKETFETSYINEEDMVYKKYNKAYCDLSAEWQKETEWFFRANFADEKVISKIKAVNIAEDAMEYALMTYDLVNEVVDNAIVNIETRLNEPLESLIKRQIGQFADNVEDKLCLKYKENIVHQFKDRLKEIAGSYIVTELLGLSSAFKKLNFRKSAQEKLLKSGIELAYSRLFSFENAEEETKFLESMIAEQLVKDGLLKEAVKLREEKSVSENKMEKIRENVKKLCDLHICLHLFNKVEKTMKVKMPKTVQNLTLTRQQLYQDFYQAVYY